VAFVSWLLGLFIFIIIASIATAIIAIIKIIYGFLSEDIKAILVIIVIVFYAGTFVHTFFFSESDNFDYGPGYDDYISETNPSRF
jgi:energy-coupling factor transporter transmembrane protein EcfT